jgi:HEAT repeat protein
MDALGFAGLHGEPTAETVALVRGALADASPLVRAYAANGLVRLDADDATPEIVSALVFALSCEAPDLRSEAIDSLGRLGPSAAAAVPALAALVQDRDDPDYRAQHAAEALARMGSAGEKALLDAATGDVAIQVCIFAATTRTPAIRTALISRATAAIAAPDARARKAAATLRGRGGAGRADVAATLGRTIDNPDRQVARAAIYGLAHVGPEAKASLPRLLHLAEHGDDSLRDAAMAAIGGLGPAARSAIPTLTRLLPRGSAAALARIGPAAVPALTGALRHRSPEVRDRQAPLRRKGGAAGRRC